MQLRNSGQIEAFLKSPDRKIEVALLHGPDQGLVRERSKRLEQAVLGPEPDAFRRVDLTDADLKGDPGALYGEAAMAAMLGGDKFIRVQSSSDVAAAALAAYLAEREADAPRPAAFIVIEASELRATAPLRKRAEASSLVAALAAYPDNAQSLEDLLDTMLREARLRITAGAKELALSRLGGDRGQSRREIEKLVLYAGDGADAIDLRDVDAIMGDAAASEIDDAVDAVLSGDLKEADRLLMRLLSGGQSPVRLLRVLAMQLDRMARIAAGSGEPQKFVYGGERLKRHLARWRPELIERAMRLLGEAEMQTKTTGLPSEEIASRAFLAIARAADRPVA